MVTTSSKSHALKVYVLHENTEWIVPLREAFQDIGTPFEEWFLNEGSIDMRSTPPEGIFYNRMSASSHSRGHRYAVEFTAAVLAWLDAYDRKVINGNRALYLEVRKFDQYLSLNQFGIKTPVSFAAVGIDQIVKAAGNFKNKPFIVKPNRGGKGLGVQLFMDVGSVRSFLKDRTMQDISLDGVAIVQEYIQPSKGRIIRLEFINYQFVYALSVDTSDGFELCPADTCEIGNSTCPIEGKGRSDKFVIWKDCDIPEIPLCEEFLRKNDIAVAGIEFLENESGERYFYDVNCNTNYNTKAEKRAQIHKGGMQKIAQFLHDELQYIDYSNFSNPDDIMLSNSAKLNLAKST